MARADGACLALQAILSSACAQESSIVVAPDAWAVPPREDFDGDCGDTLTVYESDGASWIHELPMHLGGHTSEVRRVENTRAIYDGLPAILVGLQYYDEEELTAEFNQYLGCHDGDIFALADERLPIEIECNEFNLVGIGTFDPPHRIWSDRGFAEREWRAASRLSWNADYFDGCTGELFYSEAYSETFEIRYSVAPEEEVTIPLGTFTAARVELSDASDSIVSSTEYWVTPGMPSLAGNSPVGFPGHWIPETFELTAYTPGE